MKASLLNLGCPQLWSTIWPNRRFRVPEKIKFTYRAIFQRLRSGLSLQPSWGLHRPSQLRRRAFPCLPPPLVAASLLQDLPRLLLRQQGRQRRSALVASLSVRFTSLSF